MKKLLLIAGACLLSLAAFSQTSLRFGIKAGGNVNFSKIDIQNLSINGDARFGFFGGALMEISPVTPVNKFKIQLEALYNQANARFKLSDGSVTETEKMKINQISVPLLAKYFIIPELSVNLGPTFNFNLGGKESLEDTSGVTMSQNIKSSDLNTFQLGLAAGLTYYICKGLFVDARYNPLFGSVNKAAADDAGLKMRFSSIQLGLGYKF